ncbi:hypothetical protein PTI98_010928 [Pleurotus ostreatus]|nr:hypothetical protein PTI98_010928 [Pleurotus ostreatus]
MLIFTSRVSHLLARTITESLGNRIGRLVQRITLAPSSFMGDKYRGIYELIRQRLPNVRYLDIGRGGYRTSPFLYEEDFIFAENITADYTSVARFMESQLLIEHLTLSLRFVGGLHIHRESLQKLSPFRVKYHTRTTYHTSEDQLERPMRSIGRTYQTLT